MQTDSAILTYMIGLPIVGALSMLLLPATKTKTIRTVAMAFCVGTFLLSMAAAGMFNWNAPGGYGENVQLQHKVMWIKSLNVHYHVGVDGLSMPLLILTTAITVLACWASFNINKYQRGYYALLLSLLAGVIGVFTSLDLLLFYIFFEVSLFPMYFLIGIWGGPRKEYAAIKFFLYTLAGSIGILIVIMGMFHLTSKATQTADVPTGTPNFNLLELAQKNLPVRDAAGEVVKGADGKAVTVANPVSLPTTVLAGIPFGAVAFWLLFAGFAVKVPSVPVHTWLPDAHVEAPTPISMILAAVLLKMGGYGLLRISYPIFPTQAAEFWFYVALIGVVSILYAALVALAQKDFKKLVAYSSVSHMGYVVLGIAVMTPAGVQGAMFQMIAHGISSAMMFFIVGVVYDRAHHRDIPRLGGLWAQMPSYTGWAAVGIFASMGLPGLCGFIGELLVLLGVFHAADSNSLVMQASGGWAFKPLIWFGVLSAVTVIFTAAYLLWTMQRVYMGAPKPEYHHFPGLTRSEKGILATLGIAAILFGVLPFLILDRISPAIESVLVLLRNAVA